MANDELRDIERDTGRPCPRVELDPANGEASSAFYLLAREDQARAFPVWWEQNTAHLSAGERQRVLDRALGAMGDREITELLYPKPKAAPVRRGRR